MKISIFNQWMVLILFLGIAVAIKFNQFQIADLKQTTKLQSEELFQRECDSHLAERQIDILKMMIEETSNIPNEKRKAIFELKIQQDSILMDMLRSDIKTNSEILELLNNDWVYNNDTKFKSLNDK